MALQLSTGMRNYILGTGSLDAALAAGFVDIYTGPPPASADDAATGTKLVRVSNAGLGVNLDVPASGVIPKSPSETWQGTNLATGTAGYWRFVEAADTAALSTTQKRVQGTCGLAGADLNMSSVNLVNGAPQVIDACNFTMPATA